MFFPRPTLGGIIFLLLSCAAAGVAFMNVGLMTALCASVLAGIWLASFLLAHFSSLKIRIERLSAADVPGNSTAILPLKITNTSFFYKNVMVIREKVGFSLKKTLLSAVPPLAPGESYILSRPVHADRRGHYKLEKLTLISGDPYGFFKKTRSFFLPGEITITPRIEELEHLPVSTLNRHSDGGEGKLLGFAGIGGDFFGIRPFRYGDEMQHIYWRGSAARNRLMVKEFEASVTERIFILLDSCRNSVGQDDVDNNFEHLISAAASITEILSRRYCHLTFAAEFEENSRLYLSGDAAGIAPKIIEALTELRPCDRNMDDLLCDVMESLRSGDTLFLLSMGTTDLCLELVTQLRNSGIKVNFLYAPAPNFPPVEPDILREVPAKKVAGDTSVERIELDFTTSLKEVLYWNDDLEKI